MTTLPPELWQKIFKIVVEEWPFRPGDFMTQCGQCCPYWSINYKYGEKCEFSSTSEDGTSRTACEVMRLGYINLTLVCSTWRVTLIEDPELWTTITEYFTSGCVDAFVKRSRDRPLSISWHNSRKNQEAMARIMQKAHDRIRRLETAVDVLDVVNHMGEVADISMPQLHGLTLYVHPRTATKDVIEPLQADGLAELDLYMKPCLAIWSFFALPRLRKLSVHFQVGDGMDMDMLSDLADALRALPSLEELYLDELVLHNGFRVSEDMVIEPHAVQLPNCFRLELRGDQRVIESLLGGVTFPPQARLILSGSFDYGAATVASTCSTLFRMSESSGAPFVAASLDFDAGGHLDSIIPVFPDEKWTLRASRHLASEADGPGHEDINMSWRDAHHLRDGEQVLGHLCASLGQSIREVRLSQSGETRVPSPLLYQRCFSSWTLVERLQVSGTGIAHIGLDTLLASPTNNGQRILPRLRILKFDDTQWMDVIGDDGDVLGQKLVKALRERYDMGTRLDVIVVPDVEALKAGKWWEALQQIARVEQA
ncbi:unnamed protein product [Peniophora sp. CBMAI 1063]|nr:unnamed protein product [Peniophora sp. CBMAI 1063]